MADQLANGRPNEIAAAIQARQLGVDRHGLEHTVLKYELDIARCEDAITKHREIIAATQERIATLDEQIAALGD